MKLAIIGSRNFNDYEYLKEKVNKIHEGKLVNLIVSGGAKGADSMGEEWAKECKVSTLIFNPDWKKYGRGAGFVRNKKIIENCDCVLAFWDGESKGTMNSIETARKLGKPVNIYTSWIS